MTVFGVLTMIQ